GTTPRWCSSPTTEDLRRAPPLGCWSLGSGWCACAVRRPVGAARYVMLLDGKRILVTGVLNDQSIAFAVARGAQEPGAEGVLSAFGRVMSLTQRTAKRLPAEAAVVELDVANQADLDALAGRVGGRLDGVLHGI